MFIRRLLVFIAIFLSLCSVVSAEKPLKNDDVVRLSKLGIRAAGRARTEVSIDPIRVGHDKRVVEIAFSDASKEFSVPLAILQGVAYVNSGWGQVTPTGNGDIPPSYGVMGLHDDDWFGHSIQQAARLIGMSSEHLKASPSTNIRGGAALLASLAASERDAGGIVDSRLESWTHVLAQFSGIPQKTTAELFASRVLAVIHDGIDEQGISISAHPDVQLAGIAASEVTGTLSITSCPSVVWQGGVPSGNYSVGRSGIPISLVILHTTEGSAASTLSWFQNPASLVSAHYLVNRDGTVWQFISEQDTAYHCGNFPYNEMSIGIELEGWADGSPAGDMSWQTAAQWTALESLVGCLVSSYGIPLDRAHLIGHNQVPDVYSPIYWGGAGNHHDPGAFWSWTRLMHDLGHISTVSAVSVNAACNIVSLPQAGAPLITSVWAGQRFVTYDSYGGFYLINLAGEEAAQPKLGPGWYHWDGWLPGSCATGVTGVTQLQVTGAFPYWLNVRDGTQSSSNVIGHVIDGKNFVATGNTQTGFDGYLWYEYDLAWDGNARTGWSSGAYLLSGGTAPACYSLAPNANPSAGGTANVGTAQNCTGGYASGTVVSISASASSGYQFTNWSSVNCALANATLAATTCTVSGTGNATVTANFSAIVQSAPTVSTGTATSITSSLATLNGTVNPNGTTSSAFFYWGTTSSYSWNTSPQNEGSGTSTISYSAALTGLNCGTTYHFAAAASSAAGSPIGSDASFTTGFCTTALPTVTTNAASAIGQTAATLNGVVNPNGSSTTTAFDYGPSIAYANSVAAQSFGDSSSHPIYANVTNLNCGTTYHFRARGTNAGGTTNGGDMTFATSSCYTGALWLQRYAFGTPVAAAIAPATDGGLVVAGGATNSTTGGTDLIVFSVDRFGSINWQKRYSPNYGALSYYGIQPSVVRATSDGGFVIAGSIHVNASGCVDDHMWVVRIDGFGNTLWEHTYGSGCYSGTMLANDIRPTYDGGFVVVGQTSAFGAGSADALVLKLDSQGNIAWQKTYGGAGADVAHGVKQTVDGGFLVVGESSSFSTNNSVWVLKLDRVGVVQWQRIYGGFRGVAGEQSLDGGYVVVGYDGVGALLLRLNADGTIKWQEAIRSASGGAYASDVVLAWDGGYVVSGTGACFPTCSGPEAWVFKVDDAGAILWQRSYPGAYSSGGAVPVRVTPTATGGYAVAGPLSNPAEFLVMRLDGNGQIGTCSDLRTSTATATASSFTPTATSGVVSSGAAVVETYAVAESSLQLSTTNVCNAAHAELAAPTGLVATASSGTQVDLTWSVVPGAAQYEVLRRAAGGSFTIVGSPALPPFHDNGVSPDNAYLYKVYGVDGNGTSSPDSNADLATTTVFTDDPPILRVTIVKAVHLGELRTAVNAVGALAGIGAATYTDPSLTGVRIQAKHITELRSALGAARAILLLSPITYTNPIVTVGASIIYASDITDLRNGVK